MKLGLLNVRNLTFEDFVAERMEKVGRLVPRNNRFRNSGKDNYS